MSEGAASSPVTIEELLEHGRWVRRLATSLVVGEEAAEELAQASMVQAISHPPRHRGNLRAWLATITRNVARDRGRERDREKDPRWLEAVRREHGLDSGDQIVARIETQRLVSEVLLGLEPQLRDVLVLRFYDELSYREIGERLDLPAETARSRTARGLEELRRRLDQKGGESAVEWRTGLVLWIGSAEWTRLAGGSGGAVGGGLVGWAPGLSALQLFAVLLLSGLLALFAWAPWGKESLPDTLALGPNSGAPQDSSVAAAGPATETAADRTTAGSDTRAELGDWVGVSGRVLEHAGRAPVAGARVLLTEGCRRGRAKRIETETDAEGRFRFDGRLEEFELGPERLLASFEGDFVLRIETDVELASFEDTFSRATMTGDLRGQSALDADLGDLTLTHAVPLRVSLDGDWAPSGSLWMGELSPGEHPPRRFRQVGDWGASREPRLWDLFGAYVHRDASRVLIALDEAGGFAYVDVDLPLDAARPRALHLERSPPGRVEVQLLDGEDRPVQNVPVVATPLFWPLRSPGTRDFCYHARLPRPTGFDASRRSVTNEDGVAVFESLPSGTAVDAAEDAGRDGLHPAGTYVFCAGDYGSAPRPHRLHAPSVVRAGDVNRLTLRYDESRRVDIEGRVTDEDGKPLSGIPVAAVDHLYTSLMSGNQGSPIEVRDFTDSEGRYRLLDVDRQAQGVEIVSVDGVDVGRAHALYEIGVPDAGVRRFDVVLPLAKDLRGWLVDAQGQPVHRPGLTVYARPAKLDPLREHPAPDFRMAVAADGSFGTRALPEGRWVLYPFEFEARGLVPFEPLEFQLGEGPLEVIVEAFGERATRLELDVVDARGAEELGVAEAVAVQHRDGRRAPLVVEASSGTGTGHVTWNALPAGKWDVCVSLYGGRRAWKSIDVDGSSPIRSDSIAVEATGGLMVTLEPGAVAAALAKEVVTARLIGPEWVDAGPDVESRFAAVGVQARIGRDGRARFDDLPPGRYELRCAEGSLVGRAVCRVEAGTESEAKLSVEAGRELVLVGDARPWLDQWMQLRLFVRGADGVWAPWPVLVEGEAARAILPADAVEWEARWWSPAVAGLQRSTPVSDRAHGPVEGQGGARISAELPH